MAGNKKRSLDDVEETDEFVSLGHKVSICIGVDRDM